MKDLKFEEDEISDLKLIIEDFFDEFSIEKWVKWGGDNYGIFYDMSDITSINDNIWHQLNIRLILYVPPTDHRNIHLRMFDLKPLSPFIKKYKEMIGYIKKTLIVRVERLGFNVRNRHLSTFDGQVDQNGMYEILLIISKKQMRHLKSFKESVKEDDILKSISHILDPIRDAFGEDKVIVISPNINWIRVIIGKENSDIIDLTPFREDLQEMIEFVLDEKEDFIIGINSWRSTHDNDDTVIYSEDLDIVIDEAKDISSIYTFDFTKIGHSWFYQYDPTNP